MKLTSVVKMKNKLRKKPVPKTSNVNNTELVDPRFKPYIQMMKMHMPLSVIKRKMKGRGINSTGMLSSRGVKHEHFTDSEIEMFLKDYNKVMSIVNKAKEKKKRVQKKPYFIPSSHFAGAKPGYEFRAGPKGLGYYLPHEPPREMEMSGPNSSESSSKVNDESSSKVNEVDGPNEVNGPNSSMPEPVRRFPPGHGGSTRVPEPQHVQNMGGVNTTSSYPSYHGYGAYGSGHTGGVNTSGMNSYMSSTSSYGGASTSRPRLPSATPGATRL